MGESGNSDPDVVVDPEERPSPAESLIDAHQEALVKRFRSPTEEGDGDAPMRRHEGPFARGELVGRYVIIERRGAGGMGEVYAAFDPELDRKVAIKVMHSHRDGTGSGGHSMMLREAKAMAKLDHPNVVAIHDVGEHEGRVFLAMEFIDGRTLGEWVEEEQPGWRQTLDAFLRAGEGLQAAHERGLVHRDFKPDNVMLDRTGRVRVMDFGLARAAGDIATTQSLEREAETATGKVGAAATTGSTLAGTPAYMAPEQFAGLQPGRPADQFSFSVSLWEALFGIRPFSGTSVGDLAVNVVEGVRTPPPPGKRVPRWLRRVCERGLEADPERRFESMRDLIGALQRGQSRARLRVSALGLGAIVLLGAGAEGKRRYDVSLAVDACAEEGKAIDAVWSAEARAAVEADTSGQATAIIAELDAAAAQWTDARAAACVETKVENTWSADTTARAHWCLEDRRLEFVALVTALSENPPAAQPVVPRSAARCVMQSALAQAPELPAAEPDSPEAKVIAEGRRELAVAMARESVGAFEAGLDAANAALANAETAGWMPLLAAARVQVGRLLDRVGQADKAETILEDAYFDGAAAGATEIAITAADALIYTVGVPLERPADGLRWAGHAEDQRSTLADPDPVQRGLGLVAQARVHTAAGNTDEAARAYEEAADLLGHNHPALTHR